jgi:hypothetical protein
MKMEEKEKSEKTKSENVRRRRGTSVKSGRHRM